jgi:hypothetical protein
LNHSQKPLKCDKKYADIRLPHVPCEVSERKLSGPRPLKQPAGGVLSMFAGFAYIYPLEVGGMGGIYNNTEVGRSRNNTTKQKEQKDMTNEN